MNPGAIAFTSIFLDATSFAKLFVKPISIRSSKLCLKTIKKKQQVCSTSSKEVISFILDILHFLQKKLPSDWLRQSFCC